jgi:hypothetical protein
MMWSKPEQLSAIGTARPLRVVYLVDLADCADQLLDTIFAEAYSRWGGRRTLIVPATAEGIDPRYDDWLWYFDADVIYSFVTLADAAVAALHERYAPAHLLLHQEIGIRTPGERSFEIRLPLEGLTSLSVLPAFLARPWGIGGPPKDIKILDKFWDEAQSPFVQENFGFLSTAFHNPNPATAHPDLFSCLTLITEASLQNKGYMKDPRARYETTEGAVLAALAERGWLLTPSNLSEFFTPILNLGDGFGSDGLTLIVGDTPSDRLLFWNIHLRYGRASFTECASLRLPAARIGDEPFLLQFVRSSSAAPCEGTTAATTRSPLHPARSTKSPSTNSPSASARLPLGSACGCYGHPITLLVFRASAIPMPCHSGSVVSSVSHWGRPRQNSDRAECWCRELRPGI